MTPQGQRKNSLWFNKLEDEGIKKRRGSATQAPELFPDLLWIWDFFNILNRQRQVGQHGPQPSSLTDIRSLAEMMGYVSYDDLDLLLKVIPELDAIILKDHYDTVEKLNKKGNKNKKPTKGRT